MPGKFLVLDHVGAQVDIKSILNANPKTKEEFVILSRQIFDLVIKRHQDKPLYATFIEAHAKELASPLRDVDIRKVASGLTALANEKQRETRDKASGKKKKVAKPALGSVKTAGKCVSGLSRVPDAHLGCSGPIQTCTKKRWMTLATIRTTSYEPYAFYPVAFCGIVCPFAVSIHLPVRVTILYPWCHRLPRRANA